MTNYSEPETETNDRRRDRCTGRSFDDWSLRTRENQGQGQVEPAPVFRIQTGPGRATALFPTFNLFAPRDGLT